jgi:hypothetical protein
MIGWLDGWMVGFALQIFDPERTAQPALGLIGYFDC